MHCNDGLRWRPKDTCAYMFVEQITLKGDLSTCPVCSGSWLTDKRSVDYVLNKMSQEVGFK